MFFKKNRLHEVKTVDNLINVKSTNIKPIFYQNANYNNAFVKSHIAISPQDDDFTLKDKVKTVFISLIVTLAICICLLFTYMSFTGNWIFNFYSNQEKEIFRTYYAQTIGSSVMNNSYESQDKNYLATNSVISYFDLIDNDEAKSIYYSYLDAAYQGKVLDPLSRDTWISAGFENLSNDDIANYISYVAMDHPILTAYQTGNEDQVLVSDLEQGKYLAKSLSYEDASNIQSLYEQIEARANYYDEIAINKTIIHDVPNYIYNLYWELCSNITYSDGIDDSIHANDIYGALIEGESKCYGMAAGFKYILDKHSIINFIGRGTTENSRHAYNMIYLDGEWYVCDLTAGANHYSQYGSNSFSKTSPCLLKEDIYNTIYGMQPDIEVENMKSLIGNLEIV